MLCWQAWKRICEASRREFQAIYDRLGVRLIERGESSYNPTLRPLVEDLCARGIAEDSEGAKVRSCNPEPFTTKNFDTRIRHCFICGGTMKFRVYDKVSRKLTREKPAVKSRGLRRPCCLLQAGCVSNGSQARWGLRRWCGWRARRCR